jgi:hypothetical protein
MGRFVNVPYLAPDLSPKQPLLHPEKKVFTRGKHQFESLEDVAEKDVDYLTWVAYESKTDEQTKLEIIEFLNQHPGYLQGDEL